MAAGRATLLLRALPFMTVLSWVAAVYTASVLLNPWGPLGDGQAVLYGWAAPDWVFIALLVASFAAMVAGIALHHLWWPYLAVAPIVAIGAGQKRILNDDILAGDLVGLCVLAVASFLLVEYTSAPRRFAEIVRGAGSLEAEERRPLNIYLVRYALGSIVLATIYGAGLALFIQYVVPGVASVFSTRMAEGIEVRTPLGVVLFGSAVLGLAMLLRVLWDGIAELRGPRGPKTRRSGEAEAAGSQADGSEVTA